MEDPRDKDQPNEPINLDYQLLKDGRIDDLINLRPDFEMQYPISLEESAMFAFFDRYINKKLTAEDEGLFDATEDQTIILDRERTQPGYRDSEGNRPTVSGFKLARYDRYKLEQRLKEEPGQEKVEENQEIPQTRAA